MSNGAKVTKRNTKLPKGTIHKILLLLITTRDVTKIEEHCCEKLQLTPRQTKEAIETASAQIAAAAIWNRDIEASKSLLRFEDLYTRALHVQDTKTAITAEKERAKLLGLYHRASAVPEAVQEDAQSEEVIDDSSSHRSQVVLALHSLTKQSKPC